MIVAIVSDIHSNLEALEAVLTHAKEGRADKIYCLGDIVGYGPNPIECIEKVRENCEFSLVGNHDENAFLFLDSLVAVENFPGNKAAKDSYVYTARQLMGGLERKEARIEAENRLRTEEELKTLARKRLQMIKSYSDEIARLEKDAGSREVYKGLFAKMFRINPHIERVKMHEILSLASETKYVRELISAYKLIERGQEALSFLKEIRKSNDRQEGNAHYSHDNHLNPGDGKYILSDNLARIVFPDGVKRLRAKEQSYITPEVLCRQYQGKSRFLFNGHSHYPSQKLREINGHIHVNVGSVGVPREKRGEKYFMKATYALFDSDRDDVGAVRICRADYNWRKTREKCFESGLEDMFL